MKKLLFAAVIFLIAVFGASAQADETATDFTDETTIILDDTIEPEGLEADDRGRFFTTWDFIKVILILLAVILVIYAIFYALKRTGGMKYQNEELIRLLGSQSLTQNGSVHLIEVGARYYLVGCGESSVTHIADVDDKETIDEIMLKQPPQKDAKKSFTDFLNLKMGRKDDSTTGLKERIRNNSKIVHDQAERLKKM